MRESHAKQNTFAILAALIWGTGFVAQSIGARYLDTFTFNASRSLVGFFALLIVSAVLRVRRKRSDGYTDPTRGQKKVYRRDLAIGGLCCGLSMAVASILQQKGLETTTSGKAGFITALYIVIVPLLGIFFQKRAPWTVWVSVAIAVAGLYCLCIQENFSIATGDFYILLCSLCFAIQILLIDHFVQRVDGVELSCVQLLVVTVFSSVGMLISGVPEAVDVQAALPAILYAGIFSSGVAYTFQILSQKGSNPTVISLLLSLESVFATLSGAVLLHDRMSGREYLGCVLMLAAVVLAQIPVPGRKPAATEK
ncbi:MAG: DMT family transporter [Oscillibacter sp.]|nr:DMT family transporter [Oscillibacter sp.]